MSAHEDISRTLEVLFNRIREERMHDVPILNPTLSVEAIGFQKWNGYWLGVLLTPWFMNLMLLPTEDCDVDWSSQDIGSKHMHVFPAGQFEFILGNESAIGRFLMCSLFSPVFEFGDHDTARIVAKSAIEEVFRSSSAEDIDQRDVEMQQIWEGNVPEKTIEGDPASPAQDAAVDGTISAPEQSVEPTLSRRELFSGTQKREQGSAS